MGLKKSALPQDVLDFHKDKKVISIILICLSSFISCLFDLSARLGYNPVITNLLSSLFLIYIFIIASIGIFNFIKAWKNKELEVRNSPIDGLATLAAKIAGLAVTQGYVGICTYCIAMGLTVDVILESQNMAPMFIEFLEGYMYIIQW